MSKNFFIRRGETLIEVMIALFVIAAASVATLSLLLTSRNSNENVANQTIALNLAREGLEGVRNVRDSNWQRWTYNDAQYWDCLDTLNCDTDNPNDLWKDGSYIVYFDDDFRWVMQSGDFDLDLVGNEDFCNNGTEGTYCEYNLRKYNCTDISAPDVDLEALYHSYGLYDHALASLSADEVLSCGSAVNINSDGWGTDFFREINLRKEGDSWRVDSAVYWIGVDGVQDVTLTTYLTNYMPELDNREIDVTGLPASNIVTP